MSRNNEFSGRRPLSGENRNIDERAAVTVTITGPANSGKSTIARILVAALSSTTAELTCDDPDLDDISWSPIDWREQAMDGRPIDIKVVQTPKKDNNREDRPKDGEQ
tara:strand:+ start:382 stop:702 length:321 start_codon:yes stop_codon:yes gene_type:complete